MASRTWKAVALGGAFGALVYVLDIGIDVLVVTAHDLPRYTLFISDAVTAIIAGGLMMRLLFFYAERDAHTEARLRTVADMNHHIRNALQVISYWATEERDQAQLRMIRQSVDRIEWALRDVLPRAVDPTLPKTPQRVAKPGSSRPAASK